MAPTEEYDEDNLCPAEDFASNGSGEDLACVSHVVDMRVAQLEGSNEVSCRCGDHSEALRLAVNVEG